MSSFEYVMVIVSIIMGLGITTLLRGAVNAIRADTDWTPGLLHSLWVVAVLFQHVGVWSLRWSGAQREEWPAGVLLFFLLVPIILYAQAELLFPRVGREVNLTKYFLKNRRSFFGLACLGFIAGSIGPFVFYEGVDPISGGAAQVLSYAVLASVGLIMAFSRNERVHLAVASGWILFLVWGLSTSLTVG